MKLRMKLMLAPMLTGAMLILTLGASVWVLNSYVMQSETAHKDMLGAYARVAGVQKQLAEMHTQLYRTVTIAGSLDEKAVKAVRDQRTDTLKRLADETLQTVDASSDAGLHQELAGFVADVGKYQKSADSAIDLATVDANTGVAALQSADGDYKLLNATLISVVEHVNQRAAAVSTRLETVARRSVVALLVAGLLAAIGAIAFSWLAQRRIVANIDIGVVAATKVAEGRLDVTPHSDDNDEIGALLRALGSMVTRLRTSIQTVKQATESIGTASAQIAAGNQDLSTRTEEQASNLQQTAASMEELTSTVKQNADTARQANQLATSASEAATQGGVVVGQVVGTMEGITASSRKIADIISVIDGIAFQTNILALNAAVEAARAGEQGRGFAVVAGEVRSLAQRSAEAAKEIKTLIGESVEKVEAGSRLVDDAGKSMADIVMQVKRVNDLIAEISSASVEQSSGIAQVGDAMIQLDQVTQQNAALVEESAAAADSLKQQAANLAEAMSVFRLGADSTDAAPLASAGSFAERRGPHRAINVERPKFGVKAAAETTRATRAAPRAKASTHATVALAKTGTDDWESF